MVGRKIFLFFKSFYMGKKGKQDGRPGKSLGNPLNMLKKLYGQGGGGGGGGARSGNLKHNFLFSALICQWFPHMK